MESVGLQHLADGDHVRMDLAPGKGLHGDIEVVGPGAGDLQHGSRGEARPGMAVVLDLEVGILLLDVTDQFAEDARPADAGHVLEADLVGAVLDDPVHDAHVVGNRMDGGVRDGKRYL